LSKSEGAGRESTATVAEPAVVALSRAALRALGCVKPRGSRRYVGHAGNGAGGPRISAFRAAELAELRLALRLV